MSSHAAAPAPQRVRCRQIADDDIGALCALLAKGFARSTEAYWAKGFARWRALPPVDGVPRHGYVLEAEHGIVGVILLIPSRRGEQVFCNLSSWYVEPDYRGHSSLLISMATKLKHVTYLNVSPAPHTWRTLETQGFRPYNFGRSAVFAFLARGSGKVSATIPEDLPETGLLRDHAAMGLTSLVCERDAEVLPFVFQMRRLDHPPLKAADLIFSRSAADFTRCAPALARHFLKRGTLAMLCDGTVSGVPSRFVPGKEPRYFKGPHMPTDLAYTEKTVFG